MTAKELAHATGQRLAELRIGSIITSDSRSSVLFVGGKNPCLIVCRARLNSAAALYLRACIPVLLVKSEKQVEQVAQLLSFSQSEQVPLKESKLALWRALGA